jgi:hypothetical protein
VTLGEMTEDEADEPQWWPQREAWPAFPPEGEDGHRYRATEALALLVLDEILVPLNGGDAGVALMVGCNDLFFWACADAEPIPPIGFSAGLDGPFWDLYDRYRKSGPDGVVVWCCLRRGMRPQTPIERDMRKAGTWTDELEALPPRDPKDCG